MRSTFTRALPAAAFLFIVAGFIRLRFGVSFSDEGYWFSAPYRYLLGDLPFKDEWLAAPRWFDIIIWQIMKVLPEGGTVLILRHINFFLHCSAIGLLCFSLRKSLPSCILFACFTASVFADVRSFWSAGYNSLFLDFTCLSAAFFFLSFFSKSALSRLMFGFLSGLFFFIAGISYFPSFSIAAIPVALILVSSRHRDELKSNAQTAAVFIAGIALFCFSTYAWLSKSDLLSHFINAFSLLLNDAYGETNSLSGRLVNLATVVAKTIPIMILFFVCAFMTKAATATNRPVTTFFAVVLPPAVFALTSLPSAIIAFVVVVTILFTLSRGIIVRADRKKERAALMLVAWGCAWFAVSGISSNNENLWTPTLIFPFFILSAAIAAHTIVSEALVGRADENAADKAFSAIAISLLLISLVITAKTFRSAPTEGSVFQLRTKFTHGKLSGIYSSEKRVEYLEELLDYLDDRVNKGDRLLAFKRFSMLNYITGTISPLNTSYVAEDIPVEMYNKTIDIMIKQGRSPEYAVRVLNFPNYLGDAKNPELLPYSTDPAIDPLFSYVHNNYLLEKTIGPYEVWRRKQKN
jgi:hypothetical protein